MPCPDPGEGRSPASLHGILFRLPPPSLLGGGGEGGSHPFLRREEGVEVLYKTNPQRAPSIRPPVRWGSSDTCWPGPRGCGLRGRRRAWDFRGPTVCCPREPRRTLAGRRGGAGPPDPRAPGQARVPRALGRGRRRGAEDAGGARASAPPGSEGPAAARLSSGSMASRSLESKEEALGGAEPSPPLPMSSSERPKCTPVLL